MSRFSTWDLDKKRYVNSSASNPRTPSIATRSRRPATPCTGRSPIRPKDGLHQDTQLPGHGSRAIHDQFRRHSRGDLHRSQSARRRDFLCPSRRRIDRSMIETMSMRDTEIGGRDSAVYEVQGSWSQHVWSWTRNPNRALHVMRYEDMLADPEKTSAALARHLLLDFTPRQCLKDRAFLISRLKRRNAKKAFASVHPRRCRFLSRRPGRAMEKACCRRSRSTALYGSTASRCDALVICRWISVP